MVHALKATIAHFQHPILFLVQLVLFQVLNINLAQAHVNHVQLANTVHNLVYQHQQAIAMQDSIAQLDKDLQDQLFTIANQVIIVQPNQDYQL